MLRNYLATGNRVYIYIYLYSNIFGVHIILFFLLLAKSKNYENIHSTYTDIAAIKKCREESTKLKRLVFSFIFDCCQRYTCLSSWNWWKSTTFLVTKESVNKLNCWDILHTFLREPRDVDKQKIYMKEIKWESCRLFPYVFPWFCI